MAKIIVIPEDQYTDDLYVYTDADNHRFYLDLSGTSYHEIDIGEIPEYTGELKYISFYDYYHALDFDGSGPFTSDFIKPGEVAFLAIAPDQSIAHLADCLKMNQDDVGMMGWYIYSQTNPDLHLGNLIGLLDSPWTLVTRNGILCLIYSNDGTEAYYDHPWELKPFGNYPTGVALPSATYPISGALPSVEYGWTDGGADDAPDGTSINLVKGYNVSGCWRCRVRVSEGAKFEWYKDGALIATETDRAKSDCRPSADEVGDFKYHCVVTFSNGRVVTTDIMTTTVVADDSGGGGENPDYPDNPDESETAEQLKNAFWSGFAIGKALYSKGVIKGATETVVSENPVTVEFTDAARQKITAFWRGFATGCTTRL